MSEFLKRKVRTYFSTFDFDKDGVISKDDWVGMAIRHANFEQADKLKEEYLKTQFDKVWEQFMKSDEEKTQMTTEMFVESIVKQRYDQELMKRFSRLIHGLFLLMDVNSDGLLQDDEYERMFVQLGVKDPSFAKETFKVIDVNGDGKLSFDEFVFAFFDFFFSEDEKSPNTFFFGPLVD